MAFAPKALVDGQIPVALSAIFTASAGIGTYVKSFTLYNTNASNQVIIVEVNRSGTLRRWRRFELQENESADVVDEGQTMMLESGDSIHCSTDDANSVDFTISGVEEN